MCHSIDPTTQPLHGSQSTVCGSMNGRSRTPAIRGENEGWAGEVFGSPLLPPLRPWDNLRAHFGGAQWSTVPCLPVA